MSAFRISESFRISECQLLDIIWNHLVLVLAFDLQFHCNLASALFGFDPKSNIKGRQNEEIKCRILVKKGKVKFTSAVHLPICNQFV